MSASGLSARIGPGILFAGAAIGTSHLVQSTRAGALFGLGFLGIILFANIVKYPAFRIGPHYAAATGESLIDGYARLGRWVVTTVGLLLLPVQAIIIAATAITTAGIGLAITGLAIDARTLGVVLLVVAVLIVRGGGFGVLDKLNQVFVATLTVATLVATALALPGVQWNFAMEPFASMDVAVFIFAVAVMGFMPSGVDLSILHSLWGVEKRKGNPQITEGDALADFHIGYAGSVALAICFLLMGAGVLHASSTEPASSAPAFAAQVLSLYTSSLGDWSGTIVGICALAVMFSTLLTVVDGMPRMQAACLSRLTDQAEPSPLAQNAITLLLVALGAVVLMFFMASFTSFIDFVTTTSFLVGPVIALLNHKVATQAPMPEAARLQGSLLWWSWFGILAMSAVAVTYFYFIFTGS